MVRTRKHSALGLVAALTLAVAGLVSGPTAGAQTNPFQRGPAPTAASVQAQTGPFAIAQVSVPAGSGPGFNLGTVYYPTDTSQGRFGAIAVTPGFTEGQAAIAWTGPFLASNGFIVFTLETTTVFDFPNARAAQMQAALNFLTSANAPAAVRARIDTTRLGVMGHSMGGGGSLEAVQNNPNLKATVPLQPWDLFVSFANVRVPTLMIGATNDFIAPPGSNTNVFFGQIPATTEKGNVQVANEDHFLGTRFNPIQARYTLSWMKRFMDNDTRYSQFLCPTPAAGGTITAITITCPV
jgi:predicted dienelactone hydrolase